MYGIECFQLTIGFVMFFANWAKLSNKKIVGKSIKNINIFQIVCQQSEDGSVKTCAEAHGAAEDWGACFSLTQPSSAGRFIVLDSTCGKVFPDLLSTMFRGFYWPVRIFLTCSQMFGTFHWPVSFSWPALKNVWKFLLTCQIYLEYAA